MDAALWGRSKCCSYRDLVGTFLDIGLAGRPLREIVERGGYQGSLALRHDVDHHLERAVLMALIEHEIGVRSSYYLLPPGDYDLDENYYGRLAAGRIEHHPALAPTARFLVELGHEVGLHNNFIQTSLQTGRRPEDLLREEIDYFRSEGVDIVGTAAHGSAFARKYKFVNHELFSQCTRNPSSTAAGVGREIGDETFRYRLHALDMTDFGLCYEAYNLGTSFSLSDTGGEVVVSYRDKKEGMLRKALPQADSSLGVRYRNSSDDGVCLLVHPDHWAFTLEGAHGPDATRKLTALRNKGGAVPPTAPGITSLDYLKDLLVALRSEERVRFLRYDDLAFPDDPGMPPVDRSAAEAAAWKAALAAGTRDPEAFHVLIQYNAEDDPGAVMAVTDLHRSLGIPYSLMTFRRWLTPAAGIVETYPLDWSVLAKDVASGLASVGYLNNALHLRFGDVAAAASDFDADVRALRALGLGCATFMPWGRHMPSRDLPDPVFVDWWERCETAPLWIYNRFGLYWASYYGDSGLRDALEGRGGEEPLSWFSQRRQSGGRHLMLLHPHHYTEGM